MAADAAARTARWNTEAPRSERSRPEAGRWMTGPLTRPGLTEPGRGPTLRDMKWVTREHPKTDRIACPWLIRKFIDPDAEIVFVPAGDVLAYAEREGATSFDAPGARYTHRDGKCSFETLIEDFAVRDPAIDILARIVHGADVAEDRDATPQSPGLLAIADGFALLDIDDQRQLALELPVYDALYAWAQQQVAAA